LTRTIATVLLAAALCACTAGPKASGPSVASAAIDPSPGPRVSHPVPTEQPTDSLVASVAPVSDLKASPPLHVAWDTPWGYAIVQVVIPVRNVGPEWVRLRSSGSSYTISAKNGRLLATAALESSYPCDLGPGETGYLASAASLVNEKAVSVFAITPDVASQRISAADAIVVTVANIKTTSYAPYESVVTSGSATNHSASRIDGFDVAALYFDASGAFVGISSLNPGILQAGETVDFNSLPETKGLGLSAVARTVAVPGCQDPIQ
jgi:hypothetical protein